jgi:hypothetical protein
MSTTCPAVEAINVLANDTFNDSGLFHCGKG